MDVIWVGIVSHERYIHLTLFLMNICITFFYRYKILVDEKIYLNLELYIFVSSSNIYRYTYKSFINNKTQWSNSNDNIRIKGGSGKTTPTYKIFALFVTYN